MERTAPPDFAQSAIRGRPYGLAAVRHGVVLVVVLEPSDDHRPAVGEARRGGDVADQVDGLPAEGRQDGASPPSTPYWPTPASDTWRSTDETGSAEPSTKTNMPPDQAR